MRRAVVSAAGVALAVIAGAVVLAAVSRWKFPPPANAFVDDSYITFRYARNLAEGRGLVWNVGEKPVEGFTSLLWTLMLAGARRYGMFASAGAEPEMGAARVLGLAFSIAAMSALTAAAWLLSRRRYRWFAVLIPFHFALNPYFVWHSVSGMETGLAECFIAVLALLSAIFLKRPGRGTMLLVSAWAAVGPAVRPDLSVATGALLLVLAAVSIRRRWLSTPAALTLALLLPLLAGGGLFAWKLSYFGTVISPPLIIKGSFLGNRQHAASWPAVYVARFVLLASPYLLVTALAGLLRRRQPMALAAAWLLPAAAYAGFFLTVLPVMGFGSRYLMPMWGLLAVLAFLSLAEVVRASGSERKGVRNLLCGEKGVRNLLPVGPEGACAQKVPDPFFPKRFLTPFLPRALIAAGALVLLTAGPLHMMPAVQKEAMQMVTGYEDMARMGKFLGTLPRPEELCLATTEAGNLPYFSRWKTVDMLGLNDAEIARYYRTIDLPADILMRRRPDVIFLPDFYYPRTLEELRRRPDFSDYREVGHWYLGGRPSPILVNTRSPRLAEFLGFFEFRWQYLCERPEDAVLFRTGDYVEAYRKARAASGHPAD